MIIIRQPPTLLTLVKITPRVTNIPWILRRGKYMKMRKLAMEKEEGKLVRKDKLEQSQNEKEL